MANITEYLERLQKLTQTNLDILQAINDSFYTKQNHLSVKIGDNQYAIPSFISLENKLNYLTSNIENLIHAPETGEVFFNFDGNSRAIEVKSYSTTPNSLVLDIVNKFNVENNDIFKDFLTPNPYVNIPTQSLPNDITKVLVKKIIPIHADLKSKFNSELGDDVSKQYPYSDLYKILSLYKQDEDYIEYDTEMSLPVRKNIGSGTYVIEQIISDEIDEHLDNYITVKFRSDMTDSIYMNSLKYRLFDETIEKPLKSGDKLVTFEGNAMVEIVDVKNNTNTITFKVLHGEFLNLVPTNTNDVENISSLSKMKFYSPIDFDNDKYVKVPLEEDKLVYIAISALNNRMNVQAPWGVGLMMNTYKLIYENGNSTIDFDTYYKSNVKNVGDVLFEITSIMSNTLMKYTKNEFKLFSEFKPNIDNVNVLVSRINTHLNDSSAVRNIRALYSQKKEIQSQLDEVQEEIASINNTLSSISFDDTSGLRTSYTSRLTELSNSKNELNTAIIKITNDIAISANNSEIPIENAKYRIRGFYDYKNDFRDITLESDGSELKNHIKGILVQYRYKNIEQEQGNALSIGGKFVFSDWNNMNSFLRESIPSYENGYKFQLQDDNDDVNEPSFNQIDIPISQGETVDIRIKVLYDFGYPFIKTESDWSPILNIKFPEEYLKDVKILDIIEENNNDIETNRFNNILKDGGIPAHIDDKITDQDMTYYHKPENISSGFYTPERRIIPLKDKLTSLDAALAELKDEVFGTASDSLKISIKHGETSHDLNPYQIKNIPVAEYSTISKNTNNDDGLYEIIHPGEDNVIVTVFNISIYNDSEHTAKLFSMFPGNRDTQIAQLKTTKYDKSNYTKTDEGDNGVDKGVWFMHPEFDGILCNGGNETNSSDGGNEINSSVHKFSPVSSNETKSIQGGNQFIYFRINDVNTGEYYYESGSDISKTDNKLSLDKDYISYTGEQSQGTVFAFMYPKLSNRYGLCLDSNTVGSSLVLAPHEEILIPIIFEYKVEGGSNSSISKIMSFEILPSLYKDPIPYTFKVTAKNTETIQDKIIMTNKKLHKTWWGENKLKYPTIFK